MEASGLSAQSSQLIEDDNRTDENLIYHLRITDPVAETGDQHLRRNNETKRSTCAREGSLRLFRKKFVVSSPAANPTH